MRLFGRRVELCRDRALDFLESFRGRRIPQLPFYDLPSPYNPYDNEGWTLLVNTPRRITLAENLELVSVMKSGENCISGLELTRRASLDFNSDYGNEDAHWLELHSHQKKILRRWREYYIIFPKAIWKHSSAEYDHEIAALCWDDYERRWLLSSFPLENSNYDSRFRILCPFK